MTSFFFQSQQDARHGSVVLLYWEERLYYRWIGYLSVLFSCCRSLHTEQCRLTMKMITIPSHIWYLIISASETSVFLHNLNQPGSEVQRSSSYVYVKGLPTRFCLLRLCQVGL